MVFCCLDFRFVFERKWDSFVQMSALLQPSSASAQSWLGSQGSSSSLVVKRTIRVDIPVASYPNVSFLLFYFSFNL